MTTAMEIVLRCCSCCGEALDWRACACCAGAGALYGSDATDQPYSVNCTVCRGRRGGYGCETCEPPAPQLGCNGCGAAMTWDAWAGRWECGCGTRVGGA